MDIVEQSIPTPLVEIGSRRRSQRSLHIPAHDFELVWPVETQAHKLVKFSTLDNYVAKVWHVQTICFEYKDAFPNKAQIYQNLKTGLSHTLTDVSIFSTYMVQDPEDPRRCNAQHDPDHAVVLKCRDYTRDPQNASLFRQLRGRQFPMVKMEDYPALMPGGIPRLVCLGAPAFTGQVSFFNEGVVLTLAFNHVGCDLMALEAFCRSWSIQTARAELGRSKLDRPLSAAALDRTRLSAGDMSATIDELPGYFLHDLRKGAPAPQQDEANSSIYCRISKHKLNDIKRAALDSENSRVSTVDALTGFTWRSVIRARALASGKAPTGKSKLGTGIDLRTRLHNPPAKNYIGAAVAVVSVEVDREVLCGSNSSNKVNTASAIRQSITDYNPDQTDKIIGILNTQPKHEIILPLPRELFFTSHEACTMYRQDWGLSLGSPRAVREPYYGRPPPRNEIVLHPRLLNGDVELTLTLENSAMDRLLHDPEFRQHAQIITKVGELPIEKPLRARL